jgi:transposase
LAEANDSEHVCEWRSEASELKQKLATTEEQLADLREQLAALKKRVFGKSSEKMPPMDREVRRGRKPDQEARTAARRRNAEARAEAVQTEHVPVPVPAEDQQCPHCANGGRFVEVGDGKPSSVTEYVPGYFRRRVFHRQTMACTCGRHIVTAPVPDKVFDRTQYGPKFISWLVVSKCCDAIPIYRLEKMFLRMGIPMSRSTMTRLFNRAGELLVVLASAILDRIAKAQLVLADETPQRLQNGSRGYMWTFIAGNLVAYQFSLTRSGDTPQRVLGGTTGTLLVDQYTGYNAVTTPGQRERAGCLAHLRRKVFEALIFWSPCITHLRDGGHNCNQRARHQGDENLDCLLVEHDFASLLVLGLCHELERLLLHASAPSVETTPARRKENRSQLCDSATTRAQRPNGRCSAAHRSKAPGSSTA